MAKAAVERKLSVIGEAMARLHGESPETTGKITDHRKIINLRNVLVHGYDIIDDDTIWSAIKDSLPILQHEVEILLND